MDKWIRVDNRPKTQKFRCPHCGKICHCRTNGNVATKCDYKYCPYCGKEVQADEVEL